VNSFPCTSCGACCSSIEDIDFLTQYNENGVCSQLVDNQCKIYAKRPLLYRIERDVKYLEKVMPYIYQLWGRGVHMETMVEGKPKLYTYDSKGDIRSICNLTLCELFMLLIKKGMICCIHLLFCYFKINAEKELT